MIAAFGIVCVVYLRLAPTHHERTINSNARAAETRDSLPFRESANPSPPTPHRAAREQPHSHARSPAHAPPDHAQYRPYPHARALPRTAASPAPQPHHSTSRLQEPARLEAQAAPVSPR